MFKLGDWINRKRHNRGFGIQSPSAFFFITQVLKERHGYYAYEELDEIAGSLREMKKRNCRRLFRIANHFRPGNCITVASLTAACAISSARSSAKHLLITENREMPQAIAEYLAAHRCCHKSGSTLQLLEKHLAEESAKSLIFIGECENQSALLETAIKHSNKECIIIVEGIYKDKEHQSLWQQAVASPKATVTYDAYSFGIISFDNEKKKQNYKLKR